MGTSEQASENANETSTPSTILISSTTLALGEASENEKSEHETSNETSTSLFSQTTTPAPCKGWCATNTADWSLKCTWAKMCAGCTACMPMTSSSPQPEVNSTSSTTSSSPEP